MNALVLSGGSIKGAFQAGAIARVLHAGFEPDLILGISVGALNGAFLVDRAGRQRSEGRQVDWNELGGELIRFWVDKIKDPSAIVRRRNRLELAGHLLANRFDGLLDNSMLHSMVHRELSVERIRGGGVPLAVGAVNMASGEITYAEPTSPNFLKWVVASTAIPVIMPLTRIGDAVYYDGGLRDIAPLGRAIHLGADRIVCIVCQPEHVSKRTFNEGNLISLVQRSMDIVTNEIVMNDLHHVHLINELIDREGVDSPMVRAHGYRRVECEVIRPDEEIDVQIDRFRSQDIASMINTGRNSAATAIAASSWLRDSAGPVIA